jgi:hypothetical protein
MTSAVAAVEDGVIAGAVMGSPELLTDLLQKFRSAVDATSTSRKDAERDRDYRDGKQWTSAEQDELRKRNQPCITINRIKPKVDFLLGLERKQRNDPKAFPRTPGDDNGANAATDGIRYVLENNHFDAIRSQVFENMLVEGMGGCDISVDPGKKDGEYRITIKWVSWDRLFFDPHSRREDFSDARYLGQVVWMDEAEAREMWPDAKNVFDETTRFEGHTDTYEDRPQDRWVDPERKRVRIVEMWCKVAGAFKQYKFTKAGLLEDPKDSPYVDEEGRPECALELASTHIDRDGNRYGVVRNWIGVQDEINKRRSKALHLLSVRQVRLETGAVESVEATRRELARPDGVIETTPGMEFEILPTGDMAAAQFQLLQEAKQEIDSVGVNAALSGTESRAMSGRALIARQEGGMAELGPIFDQLRLWQLRVYRKVWNRIRQYWTEEKWVRITDDEKVPKYVGLNHQTTKLQQIVEEAQKQGQQIPPEQLMMMQQDPAMMKPVVENNVAELDVDIILSEVPDTVAIQAEQFELLAKMAQSGVPIPPDALVEASGIRNKDKILEKMGAAQGQMPPQVQQQIQAAQEQMQAAGQEIAKREEQAKAQEQQMKEAAHQLELQERDLKYREDMLILQEQLAKAEIELATARGAQRIQQANQPVSVQ